MALWGKYNPHTESFYGDNIPQKEKDGGGLETQKTAWCRAGEEVEGEQTKETQCCGVSTCDCQMKCKEQTHNGALVILVEGLS